MTLSFQNILMYFSIRIVANIISFVVLTVAGVHLKAYSLIEGESGKKLKPLF